MTSFSSGPPAGRRWAAHRLALLLVAGLLQLALLLGTYGKLLGHPGRYVLVDHADCASSYYSLATFLRQPLRQGLLEHGQNYPFGEYIFFTDIAPLVSVPLHGLVQAVPALAPYGLYLFEVFILAGLLLSTLLLLRILRRLAVPAWLALVLSVALPWLGPQTSRLGPGVGHLALAYTPALLGPLWLLQGLHRARRAGQPTGRWWMGLGLAAVAATWIHFYYLGILGGWLGSFFGLWALREALAGRPWRALAGRAAALLVALAAATFGLLLVLDGRRAERPVGSGGYDWIEWRFQFTTLFTGHAFHKVRFLLERVGGVPYESYTYLGAFVLYGLVLVGVLAVVSWRRRQRGLPDPALLPALPPATDGSREFVGLLLLASLPLALAALGETIEVDHGGYVVTNYLNLFLWVHKLTERITQFRALARFIWPFWWALVLGFSWYAGLAWRQARATRRVWLAGLWVGLAALAVVDVLGSTRYYQVGTQLENPLAGPRTNAARALLGWGWRAPGRYQAILPLPFYHSGTESFEQPYMGVDAEDPFAVRTYQLGMVTGLPLMAHHGGRAPSYQARELMGLFRPEGPDPALLARLDPRPILVYLDSTYYTGNTFYRDQLRDRPDALALFNRMPAFVLEQHMRRLAHEGPHSLYEWQPVLPAAAGGGRAAPVPR
ncbi:hypothetical protein GO988_05050 [Hymenobacter sp. HMF4947]|uniref:DUF6311 domain-containing protein n=1 Tax=Hymenobacter ginkgonis TaxID=2682976 RepID=A0A7K1TBB1_9BACT|nr:hypothetical protein [Hymenobacter ginkgonis]MVN75687.1 hypothetical protein [Hymenobacter ginkgonis]